MKEMRSEYRVVTSKKKRKAVRAKFSTSRWRRIESVRLSKAQTSTLYRFRAKEQTKMM